MRLSPELAAVLAEIGPGAIFLVAFLETSFITGLLVPCGPVIIAAVALAGEGVLSLPQVVAAAMGGALAGDTVGFWVGRGGGEAAVKARGRLGTAARRVEPRARRLIHRYPAAGITIARLLSFVRTLMPPMAGLSGVRYRRFLVWDVLGVTLWALAYFSIGLAADEGWGLLQNLLGVGGALVFVGLMVGIWFFVRGRPQRKIRRRERLERRESSEAKTREEASTP
ncbi:MAG: DedA family protein [Gemmatimonadota bacterium]